MESESKHQLPHAYFHRCEAESHAAFATAYQLVLRNSANHRGKHGTRMPRPEHHNDTVVWERTPTTPHTHTPALLVWHLAKSGGDNLPRLHPFVQDVDHPARPYPIDAGNDGDRKIRLRQEPVRHVQPVRAQLQQVLTVRRLVDPGAGLCRFEYGPRLASWGGVGF